jgi:hypothetical protein
MAIRRMKHGFKLTGNDAREYVRQLGVQFDADKAAVPERDQSAATVEGHCGGVTAQEPSPVSEGVHK